MSMESKKSARSNGKSIDVSDMFAEVIRHWKSILLVGVVFALIGGLVSYHKSASEIEASHEDAGVAEENVRENLTEAEAIEVERLYYQYSSLKFILDQEEDYYSNSILYNIDVDNLLQYRIEYVFSTLNEDLVESFATQTLDENDNHNIAEIMGCPDQYMYANELVTFMDTEDNENSNTVLNIKSEEDDTMLRGVFFVDIKAESEDEIEQIADVVRKAVDRHKQELESAGVVVNLSETSAKYVSPDSVTPYENQNENNDRFTTLSNSVSKLSNDQIAYYNYLILADENENNEAISDSQTVSSSENSEKTDIQEKGALKPTVSKKYVAVGFVGGAVLMFLLYMLIYIMSSSVKTPEEFAGIVGGNSLGVINRRAQNKNAGGALNKALDKMAYHGKRYTPSVQLPLIASRIQRFADSQNVENIYLVLDSSSDDGRGFVKQLAEREELKGFHVEIGDPTEEPDFFKRMDEKSVCAVVGTLKRTKISNIQQLVSICNESGTGIIGSVSVV